MSLRDTLEEALDQYISDTLDLMSTVKDFFDNRAVRWISTISAKSKTFHHINEKYRRICDSKFILEAESKKAEVQAELEVVVSETLVSLKELQEFLEALERLAVTSVHVLDQRHNNNNNKAPVLYGADLRLVQNTISCALGVSSTLLFFKRDHEAFFSPRPQNIPVMMFQLEQYIHKVMEICYAFKESLPRADLKIVVDLPEDTAQSSLSKMLHHIKKLHDLRLDENFRTVMLFQDRHSEFRKEFNNRQEPLLQFLSELEACAVRLDNMNKGAKISGLVSSSVAAIGGVLSIVGLALTPVTLGASLVLTLTGASMGVTSGVNSLVTTATEVGVNRFQKKKANQAFDKFMENVSAVAACLEAAIFKQPHVKNNSLMEGLRVAGKAAGLSRKMESLVDSASAVSAIQTPPLAAKAGKVFAIKGRVVSNMSGAASEIPDLGQAAVKVSVALSAAARGGLIALNALFVGMDVFFIVKDSISLSKSSETVVSQFLRARAGLWRSEIDSWKMIHQSLEKGLVTSQEKQGLLQKPFYEFNKSIGLFELEKQGLLQKPFNEFNKNIGLFELEKQGLLQKPFYEFNKSIGLFKLVLPFLCVAAAYLLYQLCS